MKFYQKNVMLIAVIATAVLSSCKKEDVQNVASNEAEIVNTSNVEKDRNPEEEWRTLFCEPVPDDFGLYQKRCWCFEPVGTCSPVVVILAQIPANYVEFKYAVDNGTTPEYFGTSSAAVLFEDLNTTQLNQLQDPDVTVFKSPVPSIDSTVLYFAALNSTVASLDSIYDCDNYSMGSTAYNNCIDDWVGAFYSGGGAILTLNVREYE